MSEKELRKWGQRNPFNPRVTKEAKDLGKQSFNYAFLMDQNPEEVPISVTVEA